ncbi:MAG: DUF1926 domain-containing protein, partial [Caldithrix sp.]|nr:DUF1926 domain-containing protein [Caldithrix sp.]
YAEMMHWSLFPKTYHMFEDFEHLLDEQKILEKYGLFVRGGFWRNFMVKYPEVNVMHKKMLRVSQKIWQAEVHRYEDKQKALDHLWAGQCNCPYWHGVFGGLYLSHLRQAIYSNLIAAENEWTRLTNPKYPFVESIDFDADGRVEVLVEADFHNAYFRPQKGAVMFMYDIKPALKNLLDTMSRREEGYHSKLDEAKLPEEAANHEADETASIHDLILAKEPGLKEHLTFDWYEKKSFVDHFIANNTQLDQFAKAQFEEKGDFVNQAYELLEQEQNEKRVILHFERKGHVWIGDDFKPLTLRKLITIENDEGLITATYHLLNETSENLPLNFAVEFNFGLQAGHAEDRYYYLPKGKLEDAFLDSRGIIEDVDAIGLRDEYLNLDIRLTSDQKGRIWRMPVETISLSEAGFERVYQSSTVLLNWTINLQKQWTTQIKQSVSLIK